MEKPVTMDWRARRWGFLARLMLDLEGETRAAMTRPPEEIPVEEAAELLAWLEVLQALNLQVEAAVRPMLEAARAVRRASKAAPK
jgi:hypothetical protein